MLTDDHVVTQTNVRQGTPGMLEHERVSSKDT